DGREIRSHMYVIATGADPTVPAMPGLREARYLTSTSAMELTDAPKRLVVIGGGVVGLGQGQLFARLGSQVTIIGRLAPRAEPELASRLRKILIDEGITVVNARATRVERRNGNTFVQTDSGKAVEGDAVLVATGRTARVDALQPANADIEIDGNGFVKVDETLRTTNRQVFAVGDVAGGPQFVYVAAAQGHLAEQNALRGGHETRDYS